MLNSYAVDRKIKEHLRDLRTFGRTSSWVKWEQAQRNAWVNNYRERIEKFVVNLDDNMESYPWLTSGEVRTPKVGAEDAAKRRNLLKFRGYKSEKVRVQEAVQHNTIYQTVPIGNAVITHKFRDRDKTKEIQPSMKFMTRNQNGSLPSLSTSIHSGNTSQSLHASMCGQTGWNEQRKLKLHFKSAQSMLLNVGVMRGDRDDAIESSAMKYDRLVSEVAGKSLGQAQAQAQKRQMDSINDEAEQEEYNSEDPTAPDKTTLRDAARQSKVGNQSSMLKEDPLLRITEKILTKCNVIQRKMRYGVADRRPGVPLDVPGFLQLHKQLVQQTQRKLHY